MTPTPLRVLGTFLSVGAQSFGGGATTQFLLHDALVTRRGWITNDEFARAFALCRIAPGINLFALAVLLGRRMAGPAGAAGALVGLLLPSALITVGLTALYAQVQDFVLAKAILRGVVPATIGLGLVTAYQVTAPLLKQSRDEGRAPLWVGVGLVAAGATVVAAGSRLPIVFVLIGGGVIGALAGWLGRKQG